MKPTQSEVVTRDIIQHGEIWLISINRPEVRNCVNRPTADALEQHFNDFDNDANAKVAILTGKGGHFCAGADLKAVASGNPDLMNRINRSGAAPMGVSRLTLQKPVIAAVSGYCVAGGLELACWADLRVADQTAVFGVFCRRFGVPLIDGGTVRLPRLIGQSRAMDMILTGREVLADEAFQWGLANRLATQRSALDEAILMAEHLCKLPQICMRNDRMSALSQWGYGEASAMMEEFEFGLNTLGSGETKIGAEAFTEGAGRHGAERQAADS
ncbi:MAG TPA: crotonase/enoyl-CoA hydratase family protein [Limnobacter sp.]|uniref:crotonase/enoyl-CoA hydratase family protein n=1 Tax=Limnobacter sp. TaxID=2003368 RepID=UPI002E33F4CB|nr:crotonase/enoyl-CoA hydratase family protein [Limnobacter sp.]HEX5487042.1 crotonase/enoyl-CoA hydratase family protein [Limnobacter sp.]